MKTININGIIILNDKKEAYDFYEIESTCPNDVLKHLNGEDVKVIINSHGGSIFAGAEIYTALKTYQGKVTIEIHSFAGSSASIVAMAGDEVYMSPIAQMMIHNVSITNSGDYRDMEQAIDILKSSTDALANAYVLKTGINKEEILAMMDKETWLNAERAVELGFADNIMFQKSAHKQEAVNPMSLVASYNAEMLPQQAINKFNDMKNEKKVNTEKVKHMTQINLLKLKEIH